MDYSYPTAFSSWSYGDGSAESAAIERVLRSGRLTMGPEVAAFEREFADFHDRRHGIMVNSGSSANLVATAALFHKAENPLKRGDMALVPALAWSTTYAPLVQHGLELMLADCDETWNAAPEEENADLFVGCSILGNPAQIHEWWENAEMFGAYFIEDNCESLGAVDMSYCGGPDRCGTLGIMSTFSFFWSHQLSAVEGGMILTDDDELAGLCRMLRAHGWSRDVKPPKSFDEEYSFEVFGYNVRPVEMHAAVAREQLRKLPQFIDRRRENHSLFLGLTEGLPITHPTLNGRTSPFGLQFTVDAGREARSRLVGALRAAGIDCRLPTGGSFLRHAYSAPYRRGQTTPNADRVHDTGLFLGNGPIDLTPQIARAAEIIRGTL